MDIQLSDGAPLAEKQLIQAMLADSVTELWATRLMTYEAGEGTSEIQRLIIARALIKRGLDGI